MIHRMKLNGDLLELTNDTEYVTKMQILFPNLTEEQAELMRDIIEKAAK